MIVQRPLAPSSPFARAPGRVTLSRLGAPLLSAHDARTFLQRWRGLHGVSPLGPTDALLLSPCRAVQTFGMSVAIDVAFVDANGVVLKVVALEPGRMAACMRARAVVEMQRGTVSRLQLAPGQTLARSAGEWS